MVVFDTDFIIALIRGDTDAQHALERYQDQEKLISTFTFYELLIGCARSPIRKAILHHLFSCLADTRIILFDDVVSMVAARNAAALSNKGRPIGVIDNFIGSTCIVNQETIVTRNQKHFKQIPGLKVEPW